jgi:hypothetical protein
MPLEGLLWGIVRMFSPSRGTDMTIRFREGAPMSINCQPFPLAPSEKQTEYEWIKENLNLGRLVEKASPIVSKIYFRGKKCMDKKRVIIDYWPVNFWMIRDHHNPLTNINQALKALNGKKLFLKFNLRDGYNNLRITEEDQYKDAIKTHFGTFISTILFFRLCNAPAFFQRQIRIDFRDFLEKYRNNADNYMDDFWIATDDTPEGVQLHMQAIHDFLDTCEKKSYFLKPSKCQLLQWKMTLLGWEVMPEGHKIDPDKIAGIADWPQTLKTVREVQ